MTLDNGNCPICGNPITRATWVGHINTGEQPHGHVYQAFCESCQIVVQRNVVGKEDSGWLSSSVDKQNIVGELSQEEVAQVEKMLAMYPHLLTRWQEFISQKQGADIVCRFK